MQLKVTHKSASTVLTAQREGDDQRDFRKKINLKQQNKILTQWRRRVPPILAKLTSLIKWKYVCFLGGCFNHFPWTGPLISNSKGRKQSSAYIRKHTHAHTHTVPSINLNNKQKQTRHTPKYTHPFIEYPFSEWLPAVNNKHTDCLEVIKRPRSAYSSQLDYCMTPVPLKSVGVAHCIVCYSRVLFKESKSLNIRTKVPQGLADWGLPPLALIPNRGLGEGGNVWAEPRAKSDA